MPALWLGAAGVALILQVLWCVEQDHRLNWVGFEAFLPANGWVFYKS